MIIPKTEEESKQHTEESIRVNFWNFSFMRMGEKQSVLLEDYLKYVKNVLSDEIGQEYMDFWFKTGSHMTYEEYKLHREIVQCELCGKAGKDVSDKKERWLITSEEICENCLKKYDWKKAAESMAALDPNKPGVCKK